MTTCTRCHKPLTDPDSIARGFGPECWAEVHADRSTRDEHLGAELGPLIDEVLLQRDPKTNSALTNIVHRIVDHSPTGFDWGYGGSGPADLALNILLYFVEEKTAYSLHQDFKWHFLAGMPKEGGRISKASIQDWVNARTGALPLVMEA